MFALHEFATPARDPNTDPDAERTRPMNTTTLITSALIGRARERSMSLGFASAAMPAMHSHAVAAPSVDACVSGTTTAPKVTTAPDAGATNQWLGGFQGKGFGSGAYGTKRIHPGRLEGMT